MSKISLPLLSAIVPQVLHEVESVCHDCLRPLVAQVVKRDGEIYLYKRCPDHGESMVRESASEDFYHVAPLPASGQGAGCGCGPSGCGPVEPAQTSAPSGAQEALFGPTCVALIEITDACNLTCPLCFAASSPQNRYWMSAQEYQRRLEQTAAARGGLDLWMISGGEPTIHPEFLDFVRMAYERQDIKRVIINTNGVRLARHEATRQGLAAMRDRIEVYLQMDAMDASIVEGLRGKGASLIEDKLKALDWMEQAGIAVTFAITLPPEATASSLEPVLSLALERKNVRGITVQPAFASGRHKPHFDPNKRQTTPEVVKLICDARPDLFHAKAFANLPCSHPNCAIVAYYYRHQGRMWPLNEDLEPLESLRHRIDYNLEDLAEVCGCETTELGQYITRAEMSPDQGFRLVVKPFMDRFNLNRDRTAQCCTHVVGPDEQLMSFCEYNIFRSQLEWNTNQEERAVEGCGCGDGACS